MHSVNLCYGVVVFFIYCLNTIVISVKIECVPLEDCPFATNILSKQHGPKTAEILTFFRRSKCGYEDGTKKLKIWCTRFTNCRTSNNKFGTCIPANNCAKLEKLLNINTNEELKLPFKADLCNLPQEPEVHVCCPWPAKTSRSTVTNEIAQWNQEGNIRSRRQASNPWFAYSNGNNFFDAGQFYQNVYGQGFGSANNNNNFDWSKFDFRSAANDFSQQNTNFLDRFKTGQNDFVNQLRNSLREQKKRLDSGLYNATKAISERNQNTTNQLLNWLPKRKTYHKYSLTEETSDSVLEICLTPDNFEGICKEYQQCPTFLTALNHINSTDFTQAGYLKNFNCTSTGIGNYKVCCSENPIVLPGAVTRTNQSDSGSPRGTSSSLDLIANTCGRQNIDDKIIGGSATGLAEFPWTALLQYTTSRGLTFGCGGTIISNRYIVTAAHCVDVNILRQAGLQNLQNIVLGEYDRRNETDCIYTPYGSDCADPPQTFGVERVIQHELFKSNTTPNDIALVRVDRNITFSNYISPICLPTIDSPNLQGDETFTITGWGRTETGELSPVKLKANLPFISKNNCSQLGPLIDGQRCLGSGKGIDSCRGDSGGPVMYTATTSNGIVTTLVGVISFGFGRCGTTTSVSTYVPQYVDWIRNNMS